VNTHFCPCFVKSPSAPWDFFWTSGPAMLGQTVGAVALEIPLVGWFGWSFGRMERGWEPSVFQYFLK